MLNRSSTFARSALALSLALMAGCGGGSGGGGLSIASTAATTTAATTTAALPKPATTKPATTKPAATTPAPVVTPAPAPPTKPPAPAPAPPPLKPPAPPAPAKARVHVAAWLPYWAGKTGTATIKDFVGRAIDEVDVFSYAANADGTLKLLAGARDKSLIAAIHNNKGTVYMTCTGANGSSVVASAARRKTFVNACVKECETYDLDGVDLDFESLKASDKAPFTRLCGELADALHKRKKLISITVIPKTKPASTWGAAAALDYRALGKVADRFKIMTYNFSGPWGKPGPIGPNNWSESVVKYALSEGIPKSKIWLGVAFYGYDWPDKAGAKVTSVTTAQAKALQQKAIGKVSYDKTYGETRFQHKDAAGVTHTVWHQSAEGMKAKCDLVKKLGIAGVCCWSVNQETRDFWLTFEREKK